MKKFRFQLQAVLTLREQAEQAEQMRCAQAFAAIARAAARLRAADAELAEAADLHQRQVASGARAHDLEHLRTYRVVLQERRATRAAELTQAEAQGEAARIALLLARQRREALEHLRNRQRDAHRYAAAKFEQKQLDEMASHAAGMMNRWLEPAPDR